MSLFTTRAFLASYKAASDIIGRAATFAVLITAARALAPVSFGLYSLASAIGWMLAVATDAGLPLYLAREIARRPEGFGAMLPPVIRWRGALAAVAIGATAVGAFAVLSSTDALAFVLIVAASTLSSLVELVNYAYRAVSRSDLESALNLVQRVATFALAWPLLAVAPRLEVLAVAMVIPPAAVLLFSLRQARQLGAAAADEVPFRLSGATLVREALPIGVGIALSALYFRVDVVLIQFWMGVEAVGRYNAVFRLVEALRLFPSAVLTVMLPSVIVDRDSAFVRRLSAGLIALGVLLAIPIYGAASSVLVMLYGEAYRSLAPALRVLLLAVPLLSLNYGLTHQIIGRGQAGAFTAICAVALAANVAANAWCIPRLGIDGAAWATVGTEALLTVGWILVLARRPHRSPPSGARARAS